MEHVIREQVKKHYGSIASKAAKAPRSCCCSGSSCGCGSSASALGYTKEDLKGLPTEAVGASLGCANPLELAGLKEGEAVLDLGSGGGIDVLAASKYVGKTGRAYGLDMTDEMLALANENKRKMHAENVEFLKGYIEDIPLPDESIDAVISNCVINLSEDKAKALSEAYRVLKKGGRFAVADIVAIKEVPASVRSKVALWFGCIAGALETGEYKRLLENAGFRDIEITPVDIYGKDSIGDLLPEEDFKDLSEADIEAADGAFAGAHIKAFK